MEITKNVDSNHVNIELAGKFTFEDHAGFKDVLGTIASANSNDVIFCMQNLIFIDSAALGMLLLAHDEAEKTGKKITVKGLSGQVQKMFDMTRMERMFAVQ